MVYKRNLGLIGLAVLGALALGLSGCGGADFGSELSARPKPRKLSGTDTQPLQLPRDAAFSIVFAPATKDPGLGGEEQFRTSRIEDATIIAAVADLRRRVARADASARAVGIHSQNRIRFVLAARTDRYLAVALSRIVVPNVTCEEPVGLALACQVIQRRRGIGCTEIVRGQILYVGDRGRA